MNIRKKTALITAVVITVMFTVLNVIWLFYYQCAKKNMSDFTYEMKRQEGTKQIYEFETNKYNYVYVLPKYLEFRTGFHVVGNYNLSENEDGKITNDKRYHASLAVNKRFLKENEFYIEVDEANDEDGIYIESGGCCERIDYNPDLTEKKSGSVSVTGMKKV